VAKAASLQEDLARLMALTATAARRRLAADQETRSDAGRQDDARRAVQEHRRQVQEKWREEGFTP
jgi:hypothetical protein